MSVEWSALARADRERLLVAAWEQAIARSDPSIFAAAVRRDAAIDLAGGSLNGPVTYRRGPIAGTRLYTCADGRHVILYRRTGDAVRVERVLPSRSSFPR